MKFLQQKLEKNNVKEVSYTMKEHCFVMLVCKKSVENTKARLVGIGILTILNGILTKDLRKDSLVNNYVVLTKHVWKTNKKARYEAITAILCKLGF